MGLIQERDAQIRVDTRTFFIHDSFKARHVGARESVTQAYKDGHVSNSIYIYFHSCSLYRNTSTILRTFTILVRTCFKIIIDRYSDARPIGRLYAYYIYNTSTILRVFTILVSISFEIIIDIYSDIGLYAYYSIFLLNQLGYSISFCLTKRKEYDTVYSVNYAFEFEMATHLHGRLLSCASSPISQGPQLFQGPKI